LKGNVIKISLLFFLTSSFFPACSPNTDKLKDIAVVNSKFDKIENTLSKYGIKYKLYNYSELENSELYARYRLIFFPCGIDNTIETNVDILSRGTTIHSVSLKKDFFEVNEEKIYKNIKAYIEDGGNAYFSDYSYKLLNGAFSAIDFYDDFPNLGLNGRISLELRNDLIFFHKDQSLKVYMDHSGWVVAKSIANSETLAESEVNTIRDPKRCPIISVLKRGSGEIIYSSYHKQTNDNEIERYIVYRLAYRFLADKLIKKAFFWDQTINCTIIDSVREWENYRSYIIPAEKGNNTVYFLSEKGPFQISVFDKDKKLIISRDSRTPEFSMNIKSDSFQYLILKVYPANPKMLGAYSIVSASGMRLIPYYKKALYIVLFIAVIIALYWLNKNFGLKKFSGRFRQK
jgi:hypothetical protein